MKNILVLSLILYFQSVLAQISSHEIHLKGKVAGEITDTDSIHLNSGLIDEKYFELPSISAKIVNQSFEMKAEISYPYMFRVLYTSDKNKRVWRPGKYFLDQSSNFIMSNISWEECNKVNGQTADEYHNRFIPFFFPESGSYDCKLKTLEKFIQNKSTAYDSLLFNYVNKNPNSYVALWHLIERFSLFGHTEVRERTLNHFSSQIRKETIWKILNTDLKNARIKENKEFPALKLQTFELQGKELSLPKAKYILLDFWFSRCVPCLEALPSLKKLYANYQSKGFEIVSISTDKTQDLSIWQKRVKENGLSWLQYLDENGVEAEKLSIRSFPTTFLLNDKGEIINKYITVEDLEMFLKENL